MSRHAVQWSLCPFSLSLSLSLSLSPSLRKWMNISRFNPLPSVLSENVLPSRTLTGDINSVSVPTRTVYGLIKSTLWLLHAEQFIRSCSLSLP